LHPLLLLLVHYASFKYHTPEFDSTKDLDVVSVGILSSRDPIIIFETSDYYSNFG